MAEGEAGEQMHRRGVPGLDPGLALTALHQAVAHGEAAVVVADVDWARFVPAFTAMRPSPLLGDLPEVRQVLEQEAAELDAAASGGSALAERLAAAPAAERERLLSEAVRAQVATVLGYPSGQSVDLDQPFGELGVDSLAAVELRNGLNGATGLRLPSTLVFDHPTTAALIDHLRERLLPDTGESAPVDAEIDALEASLDAIAADDTDRTRITTRLEALVAKWKGSAGAADGSSIADRIESASDDEIFDLLGNEFGIS
ncbi:hypothetical protein J0910_03400 [Nocardiopsis sp. CNT-189]